MLQRQETMRLCALAIGAESPRSSLPPITSAFSLSCPLLLPNFYAKCFLTPLQPFAETARRTLAADICESRQRCACSVRCQAMRSRSEQPPSTTSGNRTSPRASASAAAASTVQASVPKGILKKSQNEPERANSAAPSRKKVGRLIASDTRAHQRHILTYCFVVCSALSRAFGVSSRIEVC